MQMYSLEGGSRWNIDRAAQAMNVEGTSKTYFYDIRMKSALNSISEQVLGEKLLPEYNAPGKPKGIVKHSSLQTGTSQLQLHSRDWQCLQVFLF